MRQQLVFYLNGVRHEVTGAAATLTLTDYLRSAQQGPAAQRLTGTKVACAEGDCGACTVLVGEPNAAGDGFVYRTIDACIAFVFQLDRRHVVTVEGLGDTARLTPVQQAMVAGHGSQCGFCTPGFVMAIHGHLADCEAKQPLGDDSLREGLSGNLCRCTGYQQILDACHAVDLQKLPAVDERFDTASILRALAELGEQSVCVTAMNGAPQAARVMLPRSLADLVKFRSQHPAARLVAGATDLGVQHNHGRFEPHEVIVTSHVKELNELSVESDTLTIGAAVTWDRIAHAARDRVPEYARLLSRFGSPQVRHAGTLAGNLANASPIADSIPFHMVCESTIEAAGPKGKRAIPIAEFYLGYKQTALTTDEVIARVLTPLPGDDVRLKLYKITKRRDMDISTVTAAFWLRMDGQLIREARVATGGVGPTVVRLPLAERALTGVAFSLAALQHAGAIARTEVSPITDVRGSAGYRLQLVENLFAKCYHDLAAAGQPAGAPA